MSTLGERVAELREERGISQTALAKAVGLSRSHLGQVESGKIAVPGADIRRRLAKALGVSHVELLIAAGELAADEVAAGGVVEIDESDPRELLAQRVRRIHLREDDLAIMNRNLDIWEARNKREREEKL